MRLSRAMDSVELDNRGLAPPEPMVRVLVALHALKDHERLRVLMDREPFPLYRELERRGLTWTFGEEDGAFVLMIERRAT